MLAMLGYVALGGACGSVLRVLVGLVVPFPFGTLTVNVLGSFLIGVVWASGVDKAPSMHPFLMLGILGGFTTFSTFSLDVLRLVEASQYGMSLIYVLASVLLSLAACVLGAFLVVNT